MLDTLAAVEAERGRFGEASRIARRAASRARALGQTDLASRIEERESGYRQRRPHRETTGEVR